MHVHATSTDALTKKHFCAPKVLVSCRVCGPLGQAFRGGCTTVFPVSPHCCDCRTISALECVASAPSVVLEAARTVFLPAKQQHKQQQKQQQKQQKSDGQKKRPLPGPPAATPLPPAEGSPPHPLPPALSCPHLRCSTPSPLSCVRGGRSWSVVATSGGLLKESQRDIDQPGGLAVLGECCISHSAALPPPVSL